MPMWVQGSAYPTSLGVTRCESLPQQHDKLGFLACRTSYLKTCSSSLDGMLFEGRVAFWWIGLEAPMERASLAVKHGAMFIDSVTVTSLRDGRASLQLSELKLRM
jgi:hypothetical protein